MQIHFNTIREAREHIKSKSNNSNRFNREEASDLLGISTATLHRLRKNGAISAIETSINNTTHVSYTLEEIAKTAYKKGIKQRLSSAQHSNMGS